MHTQRKLPVESAAPPHPSAAVFMTEPARYLTCKVVKGDITPYMSSGRKVTTAEFFATHAVFSLSEAEAALAPSGGRGGTLERLKHHLKKGRLMTLERGVYAVVPAGMSVQEFRPDAILTATAARPDAVFSHHAALELLGTAQSVWSEYTVYTARPRRAFLLEKATVRFLKRPAPMVAPKGAHFATRKVERRGRMLEVTSPERTLVEGFRRPSLAGGLEELVQSSSGFPVLDLELLHAVLRRYDIANLWAATGWFLERFQRSFHVPDAVLDRMSRHGPRSPQYMERGGRGGVLASRWNLIVPRALAQTGGPDER